ncbi:unannotated protein [freshwater metagenome]|uniref:Unannotated protein n=1 Tax=freshwater metagenome TaxID=449393 RepID=A0A6J7IZY5_9ZZZZ
MRMRGPNRGRISAVDSVAVRISDAIIGMNANPVVIGVYFSVLCR